MSLLDDTIRPRLKAVFPAPIRKILRAVLHYFQRLGRWPIILWQVRGYTVRDELILLLSALAAPACSLRNLLDWQDPVLLWDADVVVGGVGRFLLRARCDDLWHVLPWRERAIFAVIRQRLQPGDIFVDAGANIGVYTVLAAKIVGPSGRVIAVEMMPETIVCLSKHLELNHLGENIEIVPKALAQEAGREVEAIVRDGRFGQASIAREQPGDSRSVCVPTETLEQLLAPFQHVTLLKMDLEGAELVALKGAHNILKRIEVIVYERNLVGRSSPDAVGQRLECFGFSTGRLDGNNWIAVQKDSP